MRTKEITNPKTNRKIKVKTWRIEPREICAMLKDGRIKSAKDLSWMLLSDTESIRKMESQEYGDSASNNFALNIFENALDWGLGLRVISFIRYYVADRKMPKPFEVAASKSGDIFIITQSGRIY